MIHRILVFQLLGIFLSGCVQRQFSSPTYAQTEPFRSEWWRNAVFYQIYPRSFYQSPQSKLVQTSALSEQQMKLQQYASGNLLGIAEKMKELEWLGVDALWITPFYDSPNRDFGYDVRDYKKIAPDFGTLEDFKTLTTAAKQSGIRVIIDMVLNHTSEEHEWFQAARDPSYPEHQSKRNWYMWHDGTRDSQGNPVPFNSWDKMSTCGKGKQQSKPTYPPPNNWKGFENTTWSWDPLMACYYYHYFYASQPDLNFMNPEVVEAVVDILKYWRDLGVSGFRLDAVQSYFVDPRLPDNPPPEQTRAEDRHILLSGQYPVHNANRRDVHPFLQAVRIELDRDNPGTEETLLVGEVFVANTTQLRDYYGLDKNGSITEIHLPFNFSFLKVSDFSARAFASAIQATENDLDGLPTTVVLSNHDFSRAVSRFEFARTEEQRKLSAVELAKLSNESLHRRDRNQLQRLLMTLLLTMRGAPFIYYGEELGLSGQIEKNRFGDPEHFRPPLADDPVWDERGRDHVRRPMPWTNAQYGGFSQKRPWLSPIEVEDRNWEKQKQEPGSPLHVTRALLRLRKSPHFAALKEGRTVLWTQPNPKLSPDSQQILAYRRVLNGHPQVMVLLNMSDSPAPLDLSAMSGCWESVDIFSQDATEHLRALMSLDPLEAVILKECL